MGLHQNQGFSKGSVKNFKDYAGFTLFFVSAFYGKDGFYICV